MTDAVAILSGKAIELIASQFKDCVVARWSRHRAEAFMDELVLAVGRNEVYQEHPEEVRRLLDGAMRDDRMSCVLFESYRRVCLSASKEIGPRIVGHITALLILEDRTENEGEEIILRAAEGMTDTELLAMADFVRDNEAKAEESSGKKPLERLPVEKSGTEYVVQLFIEKEDSSGDSSVNIGMFNLAAYLGTWAGKAEWLGLLRQELRLERRVSYYHVEPLTITEYIFSVAFGKEACKAARLIEQYKPSGGACRPGISSPGKGAAEP